MAKFNITSEELDIHDNPIKNTKEFQLEGLYDVLIDIRDFLRGCGYDDSSINKYLKLD